MMRTPRMVKDRAEARWTREEDDLLRRRHLEGRNEIELARLHGRNVQAIRQRLMVLKEGRGLG